MLSYLLDIQLNFHDMPAWFRTDGMKNKKISSSIE
jgi:hypothetical protein